ncbi:MAG: hypothetical protein NTV08_08885 [Verrucomicrobia bacterium]|nr:hypothetical protein [Verrucomicrobiota bacterium]
MDPFHHKTLANLDPGDACLGARLAGLPGKSDEQGNQQQQCCCMTAPAFAGPQTLVGWIGAGVRGVLGAEVLHDLHRLVVAKTSV